MFAFATTTALILAASLQSVSAQSSSFPEGVIATGTQGVTNPPVPTAPTSINQTSDARLLSINAVDDWCIFAPPNPNTNISDSEQVEVAWCTKPRNDARVIPDGTITGVSFLKTDFYVQIIGYGDLTKLNLPEGDEGGELDPHGATGNGNPIGGNVTSTVVDGEDEPFAEWMLFISYQFFCIRVCTNANSSYSAAAMCEHKLDEMGCEFVMPGNYNVNGTFETCDADVAYPPGWYPSVVDGTTSFSTFAQYFTGTYDVGTSVVSYTVGDTVTPTAAFSTPSSSNCVSTSTISNGIALASLGVSGSGPSGSGPTTSASGSAKSTASGSKPTTGSGSGTSSASSPSNSNAALSSQNVYPAISLISVVAGVAAVVLFH